MGITREKELQKEFERKLDRTLNMEELLFIQWLTEQQQKEKDSVFVKTKN